MAAIDQGVELHEARPPFDGVKPAEYRIEQVPVFRIVFQLNQLLGQLLENLAGLNKKVLEDLFIRIQRHRTSP